MQVGVGELGTQEAGLGGSCGWESPGPHRHHQLSPISYASKVRTLVLIVHGQDDTNVPVGQAVYFHRVLSRYGVEHELVIYPREGHTFTERQHRSTCSAVPAPGSPTGSAPRERLPEPPAWPAQSSTVLWMS